MGIIIHLLLHCKKVEILINETKNLGWLFRECPQILQNCRIVVLSVMSTEE